MALLYPSYLKSESASKVSFSDNALHILRLQAEGMSNKEIADVLNIAINTVKYHSRENYKKLNVSSKAAAVTEARKRNLI